MAQKPRKDDRGHAAAMELVERSQRSGDARPPKGAKAGRGGGGAKPGKGAGDRAKPKKPARKGGSSRGGGGLALVGAWIRAILLFSLLGGLLGGAAVGGVIYRGALARVDARMGGPVWTVPGRVWSGPIELWPGLSLDPDQLAADLVSAGYARVTKAEKPGDFQLANDALLVKATAQSGPGWKVNAGDVLVTFKEGRVSSVSPQGKVRLAPMVLATVRGADNENRNPVPLERIPEVMKQAVLAMEDSRFYDHEGIDPLGIARAMWVNARQGAWTQGGSTLTQQLAKNVFLSTERTADRKAREAFLSIALERRLTKDEILQLYLNEIYLGQAGSSSICGVDAAARAWFGKPVERVTLAEAATIAGIIASPNQWSPLRHPDASRERRDTVLDRMKELGWIDARAHAEARSTALELHPAVTARQAPWATDLAVETVEEALGPGAVARDGLDVTTALSPTLQHLAERAIAEGAAELVAAHPELADVQAAIVVVRASDGAVVAMVGGRDYATSSYNRAVLARRQIGSTVKALTMLVALEADPQLSPATRLDDAPLTRTHDGKRWTPSNYDGTFVGPVSLRHAIAVSRNIPAVLLSERVGLGALKDRLQALGLTGATDYPSVALGGFGATPLELAGAYSVFAADGAVSPPSLTRAARTREGAPAWDAPTSDKGPKYSSAARWLAGDVLRTVMSEGTGKRAAKYGVGPGAGGKSGTTDDYTDAWFAGVSGPYAVVVWVGHDRNQPVKLTGSAAALPIWARFVAWSGTSTVVPSPPRGITTAEVCVDTDLPPCAGCSATRTEYFRAGSVPAPDCSVTPGEAVHNAWDALRNLFRSRDPEAAPDAGSTPVEDDGRPVRIRPRDADRRGPDGVKVPE